MKKLLLFGASISFLALQLSSTAALATEDISARISKLEQELAILKRQAELDREEAARKAETTPTVKLTGKALEVESADKNFTMQIRGMLQVDGRVGIDDKNDTTTDQMVVRRARPIIQGTVHKNYAFYLMPDFGNGQNRLTDAYVEAKYLPEISLRAGKFKPSVGLEELQPDSAGVLTDRGVVSNLVSNRDVGVQVYGNVLDKTVEYQAGLLNGTVDGGNSDTAAGDSKEVAIRLFSTPFANSDNLNLQGFGVGVGGTYSNRDGTNSNTELDTYETQAQATFFRYRTGTNNVYAKGTHSRIVPQAYYYLNSFGILAEYAYTSQDVQLQSDKATLHHKAWGFTSTYALTGENASYTGLKPATNFDYAKGTWGAFELAARYGQLTFDDKSFPIYADPSISASKETEHEIGINWYLSENVRLMFDYDFIIFEGGATSNGDRPNEQTLFVRSQYVF